MDAIKFIKEKDRMCDMYCCCDGCPFEHLKKSAVSCSLAVSVETEKAVAIVEKWSREHPKKTNGDMIKALLPKERKYTLPFKDIITINLDKDWWDAESPEHDGCKDCKWLWKNKEDHPCSGCKQNYFDKWEERDE